MLNHCDNLVLLNVKKVFYGFFVGHAIFKLTYLSNHDYKALYFECDAATVNEIVLKVGLIVFYCFVFINVMPFTWSLSFPLLLPGELHPGVPGQHVEGGLLRPETTQTEPSHELQFPEGQKVWPVALAVKPISRLWTERPVWTEAEK